MVDSVVLTSMLIKLCLEKAENGGVRPQGCVTNLELWHFSLAGTYPPLAERGLVARSKPSERFEHGVRRVALVERSEIRILRREKSLLS